jgi:hypothetical protein
MFIFALVGYISISNTSSWLNSQDRVLANTVYLANHGIELILSNVAVVMHISAKHRHAGMF